MSGRTELKQMYLDFYILLKECGIEDQSVTDLLQRLLLYIGVMELQEAIDEHNERVDGNRS